MHSTTLCVGHFSWLIELFLLNGRASLNLRDRSSSMFSVEVIVAATLIGDHVRGGRHG